MLLGHGLHSLLLYCFLCLALSLSHSLLLFSVLDNTDQSYLRQGEVRPGQRSTGNFVQAEITTTFFVLIGIFFPSVTGELCVCVRERGRGREGGREGEGEGKERGEGGMEGEGERDKEREREKKE